VALSNNDILDYIFSNRLTLNDKEYLLEGNTSKGVDAVSSASYWIYARFRKAGYTDFFKNFETALANISSSSLTDLETLNDALYAYDETYYKEYSMLVEALVLIAMYKMYSSTEQEATGLDKKKEGQEIIEGLLGSSAFPERSGGSESNKTAIIAVVESQTDAEKEAEAFGMRAGYDRS
jgi:hypothetical protein